jgi:hypothetical protein
MPATPGRAKERRHTAKRLGLIARRVYLYHILCPMVGPPCDRNLGAASVGAKFCTDRIGGESRGGVAGGDFDSTSGGLVGDSAAIPDVATGASESSDDVAIAEFTSGSRGTTIAGCVVGTFESGTGSLLSFDSASCKLTAGI